MAQDFGTRWTRPLVRDDEESQWTTVQLTVGVNFASATPGHAACPLSARPIATPPCRAGLRRLRRRSRDAHRRGAGDGRERDVPPARVMGDADRRESRGVRRRRIDRTTGEPLQALVFAQMAWRRAKIARPESLFEVSMRWRHSLDALAKIGFAKESDGRGQHFGQGKVVEVLEAMRETTASLLRPSSVAMVAVNRSLDLLRRVPQESPWVTLFDGDSMSVERSRTLK